MSEKLLNNINSIPVRTWNWLGVNDVSVNWTPLSPEPYTLNIPESPIEIDAMDDKKNSDPLLHNFDYRSVSKELSELAENKYNAGAFIKVRKDQKATEPVIIEYDFSKGQNVVNDNNVIIAEEASESTLIFRYDSKDDSESFHNGLIRIYGKKDATINVVKVQSLSDKSTHLHGCVCKLEENARVNFVLVELGSKNSVTNVCTDLEGDKSSVNIHTVYLGDKERVIDINYLVNHYGKETSSNIEAKGALFHKSSKTFRGTIDFKRGTRKAAGKEEEYAVLLSKDVKNRSVPVLLCTEDDVSGEHAASAGKIDENKLFYLMTRGLREEEAKKLIVEANIRPIIDLIPDDDTKTEIYDEIRRKLIYE